MLRETLQSTGLHKTWGLRQGSLPARTNGASKSISFFSCPSSGLTVTCFVINAHGVQGTK